MDQIRPCRGGWPPRSRWEPGHADPGRGRRRPRCRGRRRRRRRAPGRAGAGRGPAARPPERWTRPRRLLLAACPTRAQPPKRCATESDCGCRGGGGCPAFVLAAIIALRGEPGRPVAARTGCRTRVLLPVAAAVLVWLGRVDVRVVSTSDPTATRPSCGWGPPICRSASSPVGRGAAVGQVGGAGPPARSGGLRRAPGVDRPDDPASCSTIRTTRRRTGWSVVADPDRVLAALRS